MCCGRRPKGRSRRSNTCSPPLTPFVGVAGTGTIGQGHVYQDRYRAFGIWGDRHYFNVVSYVEGNALRAGLVESAANWQWSSLYERQGHSRGIVDQGPTPLPADWLNVVDSCLSQEALDEIRSSLKKW